MGVAPSCNKKSLKRTPPVTLEKTVANTPSQVDALRLERIATLLNFGMADGATNSIPASPMGIWGDPVGWEETTTKLNPHE
jgi:hypothetical protein